MFLQKKFFLIISLIFAFFLAIFIFKSADIMINVPFYDFDEAHRAENAKRMKEYHSFIVPLTGSSFDRIIDLRIPFKENPDVFLYYHLERPTFIYWLMMISTHFLGQNEFAYRLPSFLLGLGTIAALLFFSKRIKPSTNYAIFIALLSLITSGSLWLSSQYAQLDTGLTFFLFLSVLFLVLYCQHKNTYHLLFAGISWALAVLSKGQPAVIIVFPLAFLFLSKKLTFREVLKFFGLAGILLIPWITSLVIHFGLKDVFKIYSGFAISSAIIEYIHHKAPIFWYIRWWFEDLRPGAVLFFSLLLSDIYHKRLDWKKLTFLSYILGSLVILSIPTNKIWWYVLPLVPAVCFYIYLSVSDLIKNEAKLLNISFICLLTSLPLFLNVSNTISMIYGIILVLISFIILELKSKSWTLKYTDIFFLITICISLFSFGLRFPHITPYHWGTKSVSHYYDLLPGKKCLWTGDMPQEAVLFYSNAGEVKSLNDVSEISTACKNFLITPRGRHFLNKVSSDSDRFKLLFRDGEVKLFEVSNPN